MLGLGLVASLLGLDAFYILGRDKIPHASFGLDDTFCIGVGLTRLLRVLRGFGNLLLGLGLVDRWGLVAMLLGLGLVDGQGRVAGLLGFGLVDRWGLVAGLLGFGLIRTRNANGRKYLLGRDQVPGLHTRFSLKDLLLGQGNGLHIRTRNSTIRRENVPHASFGLKHALLGLGREAEFLVLRREARLRATGLLGFRR
ncbi:hypothetical protein EYF80_048532 [Liparis tanakae]|uniref:Uncharacterized protein n=1 Tax=Liparis tanakae TaxID=230148 RepID=A0A4Z2FLZ7_9TELE|nr:hypothetical protein EYF80_048532 [Liparis tanakae]